MKTYVYLNIKNNKKETIFAFNEMIAKNVLVSRVGTSVDWVLHYSN